MLFFNLAMPLPETLGKKNTIATRVHPYKQVTSNHVPKRILLRRIKDVRKGKVET
jgi:hypothetical protein